MKVKVELVVTVQDDKGFACLSRKIVMPSAPQIGMTIECGLIGDECSFVVEELIYNIVDQVFSAHQNEILRAVENLDEVVTWWKRHDFKFTGLPMKFPMKNDEAKKTRRA